MSKQCKNFNECGKLAYQAKNGVWYCNDCHPDSEKIKTVGSHKIKSKQD